MRRYKGYVWYDDHGTVQNIGPDWRLIIIVVVLYHWYIQCKHGDCHFSWASKILLENLKRFFVDDDDAEVESQICHVKLMNDSVCQILGACNMLPYRCPAHKWRAHKLRAFTGRCSRSGRCESEPRSVLRALTCLGQLSRSVNMFALSWLLEVVLLLVYSLRCRYLCASICERPSTAYWHFLRQKMMEIWGESTVTYDI